ncbi:glycosylase [Arsenicibacter rosenii]|uniref:Glycosylase n=1 Tax=Arsenicibacter rosenii TaxID=1750698 RepID=A0A1S2VLM4_9BACT|nr:glycosylase [Arsenicibacter rosenii]OIN58698.1 glycosylase [Arsenicibacter rosenii]
MKRLRAGIILVYLTMQRLAAQPAPIPEADMQRLYGEIKTPYKYGLVLTPPDNSQKMDCPTVFRKGRKWYMTYIIFGGRGYETWLAKSRDLLHWETLGRLMSFTDSTNWDGNQKAGYNALIDTKWGGSYALRKFKGRYWMSYFGGSAKGYEAGDLSIGMAHTTRDPATIHEWQRQPKPLFTAKDPDTRWWENRKLFKSSVIEDKDRLTGHRFVMYYNANGDSAGNNLKTRWFERIGMAVSDDMATWQRFEKEPVMQHPVGITGDAVLQKIGDTWVMFYFGAFWQGRKDGFDRFAASKDLIHWTDWTGEDLMKPSEPYDNLYAHKPYVLKHKGVVYHFYCAVNKKEQRGIAVATSVDMGKSTKTFVAK